MKILSRGRLLGAFACAVLFASGLRAQLWSDSDVGSVSAAGSASQSNGVLTVNGSGDDIWGALDEFHFHYIPWNGDGVFIARVTGFTNTQPWAKAGWMIRSTLAPGAANVLAMRNGGGYPALQNRTTDGGQTSSLYTPQYDPYRFPQMWLRLIRTGNTVTAHFSSDGANWFLMSNVTTSLPASVYIGLAVSSHSDGALATATFDNIFASAPAAQLQAIAHSPTRVDLTWADNFTNETGFEVERSMDNASFTRLTTTNANVGTYSDTAATAATTFYYRVRAITPSGPSAYSNTVSVTTPAAAPSGWRSDDIGSPPITGTAAANNGVFTITGSGSGVGGIDYHHESTQKGDFSYTISGYADSFQFMSQPLSGDGQIVARITGITGGSTAQAGVMVRADFGPSDDNIFCFASPGGGLYSSFRPVSLRPGYHEEDATGFNYSQASGNPLPIWVKLVRANGGVLTYVSSDGANWRELAWRTIALPASAYFGLGVSSHVSDRAETGTFDNVTIGPVTAPIPLPNAPTNFATTEVGADFVTFSWTNSASVFERIELQRSNDGTTYQPVATWTASPPTTGKDRALAPDTSYFYRLAVIRGAQASYSNTLSVHTPKIVLSITNVWSTRVDLSWVCDGRAENWFIVQNSTDNVNYSYGSYDASLGVNARSYSFENLTPGTKYYFRAGTYTGSGSSPGYSNVVVVTTGTTPPPGAPTPPSNLRVTLVGTYSVQLAWNDNSTNEDGFLLYRSDDGVNFSSQAYISANATTQTDSSAVYPDHTYYYRIRAFNSSGSSDFSNVVSTTTSGLPPPPAAPTNLVAVATSSSQINLTWSDNSTNESNFFLEKANRDEPQAWVAVGSIPANTTSWTDSGLAPGTTAYYRLWAVNSGGASAKTNTAQATTPTSPPPPPPPPSGTWSRADVGPVAAAGADSGSGSTYTVAGSGNDIWETSDEFHYMYQSWSGDGTFIARVVSMDNTNGWAKAGIMLRESLAPNSRHVFVAVNPGNAGAFFARATTGGATDFTLSVYEITHMWIKLVRSGNTFQAFQSTDGASWIGIGSATTVTMPTTILAGLAVTSHNDGTLCTAHFENVSMTGSAPPPPPPPAGSAPIAPSNLSATVLSATTINVTWTDNSTDETSFELERSTNGTTFSKIWTSGPGATSYGDGALTGSTTYYYRVRAVNASGASAYSNIGSATSSTPPPTGNPTWLHSDVGAVAGAGSDSNDGATFLVTGSGADIWDNADEFHFLFENWSGDGTLIARLNLMDNTNGWAKAGIMIRESLAAGARHVFIAATPEHGTGLFTRRTADGSTDFVAGPSQPMPVWMKLTRAGNTFQAFQSTDGANWNAIGSAVTIDMPSAILAGLAVTSHNDGVYCTGRFDNVSANFTGGNSTPPPPPSNAPAAPSLLSLAVNDTLIDLAWADNSNNETGFEVERSSDNITFTLLATTAANSPHYTDTGLSPNTTYYYRVRAVAGSFASAYTPSAQAKTSPSAPPSSTWSHTDIGAVGVAGSDDANTSTTSYTVSGSGSDIWNGNDAFRFLYRPLHGDGTIEARVTSLDNTNPWAKAGLMIRQSLAADSPNAFVCVTPEHGVGAQGRWTSGADTNWTAAPDYIGVPCWLRLVRTGDQMGTWVSLDGTHWTAVAFLTIPMGADVYVGFAVTSHNNSALTTATFADPLIH